VCRVFGFDPETHTLYLARQAAGNMLGRRYRQGSNWTFVPPPETRHPFVFIDEYDKSDESVRRASLPYFQGDIHAQIEGKRYRFSPTPMLAANYPPGDGNPYAMLRPEYRRRSVMLDTRDANRREIEAAVRRFHRENPGALFDLDRIPEPAPMSDAALNLLSVVPLLLTPAGDEEYPGGRSLEIAARGYAALFHTADDTEAALAVAWAYLTVNETQPGTEQSHWRADLETVSEHVEADAETLARIVTAAQRGRRRPPEPRKSAAELDRERIAFVMHRDELAENLRGTRDLFDPRTAPGALRSDTVRMRSVWRELAAMADAATTPARLREISELTAGYSSAGEDLYRRLNPPAIESVEEPEPPSRESAEITAGVTAEITTGEPESDSANLGLVAEPPLLTAIRAALDLSRRRRRTAPAPRPAATPTAPALPGTPAVPLRMTQDDPRLRRTSRRG